MLYKFLNVIHSDIKVDNIFVDTQGSKNTLVLGDFGNTTSIDHSACVGFNPHRRGKLWCGTREHTTVTANQVPLREM